MCPVTAGRPHPDHSRSVRALIPPAFPLITYMPVCHLSAAPTDLHTVGFRQLSGFVSESLKASAAAGGLTLISGAVVSCLVLMLHATEYVEKKRFLQTGQCFHVRWYQILRLDLSFCGVTTDSFSTKAPVKESEKPQLVHPCRLTFHYPWLSREFKARSGGIFFALFLLHNLLLGYFHLPRSTSERIFPWKLL